MIVPLLIIVAWVVIGASVGFYEARRGHWRWLWLLGAIAGPFAIPMARQAERQATVVDEPIVVGGALPTPSGGLDLIVGVDGSPASVDAARTAARLLAGQRGSLVLAGVIDYELASTTTVGDPTEASEEERARAEGHLSRVAAEVEPLLGSAPSQVLLAGQPAEALERYATEHGRDVLVVGRRGRGASKRLLGSCADTLLRRSAVPVLLAPASSGDAED